jgi:hypothetical protein
MDNPQGTINVSEFDLGWVAGIIDGEGTVVLYIGACKRTKRDNGLNNVSPQVIMANTDKNMVDRYADILKGIGVGVHVTMRQPRGPTGVLLNQKKRRSPYKVLYVASTVGYLRVKKLLDAVGHKLVTDKREKALLILDFINQRLSKKGDGGRYPVFDHDDLILIRGICACHGRTKYMTRIDGLLRDCEQSRLQKAA